MQSRSTVEGVHTTRSASSASSRVAWKAATSCSGSPWMNPTVSTSRKGWPCTVAARRIFVSRVAKSLSAAPTSCSQHKNV